MIGCVACGRIDFDPLGGGVGSDGSGGPSISLTQSAYIKASNSGIGDAFGISVALSGDGATFLVGAGNEDSSATGIGGDQADSSAVTAGAVYVFTNAGSWMQETYVKASNTDASDRFGWSVAMSADGSTFAVGAIGEASNAVGVGGNETNNMASNAGAVYLFARAGSSWIQEAYVKASNTEAEDGFGYAVALSANGSTLVVGATGEASAATGVDGDQTSNTAVTAGAAYVFVRNGTTWSQQAYLKASNTDASDQFGSAIAVSADGATLAITAVFEASGGESAPGDNSVPEAGAAYVFVRNGTTWSQQAYVKASAPTISEDFGISVALSADGSLMTVGAFGADVSSGAVYIFTRNGTTWSLQARIKASNAEMADAFGGVWRCPVTVRSSPSVRSAKTAAILTRMTTPATARVPHIYSPAQVRPGPKQRTSSQS